MSGGKLKDRIPVVSLGITQSDPAKSVLIEATPDITTQWQHFRELNHNADPTAIFITHGHMGHYSGLMQLGREARNTAGVNVYGHSSLIDFLKRDQPWKQLVTLGNIRPQSISTTDTIQIGQLRIQALLVPHRDEISATYAYLLQGPSKRVLFLPDIDKWEKWTVSLDSLIQQVDYAFLDATFYDEHELPGRKLSDIPHPTVREMMDKAHNWSMTLRQKVYLIHFNHTNPLLNKESDAYRMVIDFGFHVADIGNQIRL